MPEQLRTGSLCTGYGGLDAAVSAVLGGELAWVADNDPGAAAVLAHHFPSVPNLGDIKAVDWVSLGTVDIFCGGFPCQPFSQAGLRLGAADERHIWPYIASAVSVLRPAVVVLENVLGLLSARGGEPTAEHLAAEASRDSAGRLLAWLENELALAAAQGNTRRARQCRARADRTVKLRKRAADRCQRHERRLVRAIGTVLASLAALGYDAEWVTVTASAAGACHRRARLFILAFPAQERAVAEVPVAVITDGAWLEPGESLFGVLPFAGRVPGSGRMAGGRVYPAEDGPAAATSGLLKTPTAQLAADQAEHLLLPTPRPQTNGGGAAAENPPNRQGGQNLMTAVALLPTPGATDGKGGNVPAGRTRADGRPRTDADADLPASAALLPTPDTGHSLNGHGRRQGRAGNGHQSGASLEQAAKALLPTPNATDGQGGPRAVSAQRAHRGKDHGPGLRDVAPLLPTPSAMDSHGARNATAKRNDPKPATQTAGWTLSDVIWGGDLPPGADAGRLLPTPAAGNFNDGESPESWQRRKDFHAAKETDPTRASMPLAVAAQQLAGAVDWGPYEAAVRRWEAVLGRPAPRPTVPGKTGQRLNPELAEWMMGLPAGWITGVPGLSRNAVLKLAGNGVVPQQGALAVRLLLRRVARDKLVPAVLVPFLDRAGLGYGEAA